RERQTDRGHQQEARIMKITHGISLLALSLLLAGCGASQDKAQVKTAPPPKAEADPAPARDMEAKIKETLAKMSDEDREAAEIQRFCAFSKKGRLGSMGVPVKITIKNQDKDDVDVFLCCAGCETGARKDEAKTAARVEELNIQGYLAKLSAIDRDLAETQNFCPIQPKSRLGSMGTPVAIKVKNKAGEEVDIFHCCKK